MQVLSGHVTPVIVAIYLGSAYCLSIKVRVSIKLHLVNIYFIGIGTI